MNDCGALYTFLIFGVFLIAFGFFMLNRNKAVAAHRRKIIYAISPYGEELSEALFDEYESVSYEKQFIQFWRPLSSFWPKDGLLRKHGIV